MDRPRRRTKRIEVEIYEFWWKELNKNISTKKTRDVYSKEICCKEGDVRLLSNLDGRILSRYVVVFKARDQKCGGREA